MVDVHVADTMLGAKLRLAAWACDSQDTRASTSRKLEVCGTKKSAPLLTRKY